MDEKLIIFVTFLGTGMLIGGLGVPLMLEMIPPNPWYGFKTPSAVENEEIWYPVNRVTGYWCVLMGVGCSGTAICAYLANLDVGTTTLVNTAICLTCAVSMIAHSFRVFFRLKAKLDSES